MDFDGDTPMTPFEYKIWSNLKISTTFTNLVETEYKKKQLNISVLDLLL
jgi:hypothetical protein